MSKALSLQQELIDEGDSILIVVDVQDMFLAKLPADERETLVNRIGWLIRVAEKLGVPVVAMAEDLPRLGGPTAIVADSLPPGTPVFNKMTFGLAWQPDILEAVERTGRKTVILVGLETDVCISHSALGLLQKGFDVVIPADATASPGSGHDAGLERMRRAGALITTVKSTYHEWIRTAERDKQFRKQHLKEIGLPTGVML